MRLDLLRDQVALRDLDLLLLGVAGEANHLQAVLQRLRDRVHHVGGGDEEHRRQVELDVEVVVGEGVVLLRVEHLEQRRRGVAAEVHRHLVDLVEQEHRVARARLLHHLDDLAREGADVGAAVAADLGLVAHAAEREPHELAVRGAGDRAGERGLADAGRPDEAQDRTLRVVDQLAHGQELDDALLDLLEAVVVLVQDLLGGRSGPCARASSLSRARRSASRGSCARRWPRPTSAASTRAASAPGAPSPRRPWACAPARPSSAARPSRWRVRPCARAPSGSPSSSR